MAIRRFEDIQAWQEARKLVKVIYILTGQGKFAKGFGLRDQIRRASVSIEEFKTYYAQADKAKALTGAFRHALLKNKSKAS